VFHQAPDSLIWSLMMPKLKRYELTPDQWARITDLLPGKAGDPGRSGSDNLPFCQRGTLGPAVGRTRARPAEAVCKWKTAHKRFTRWAKNGVLERVFEHRIDDPDKPMT
jgi:transposase